MNGIVLRWSLPITIGVLALSSCSLEEEGSSAPTWEEFRSKATRVIDGREVHIVEWDLAISEDELRERYQRLLDTASDLSVSTQESIVNRVGGVDDVWSLAQARNLTYCVSNDFGANKARAVAEMDAAARAWEAAANIDFKYVPAHDAACNNSNSAIVFSVRPWSGSGGCAFFPSGGGCVPRTVVMNFADLDTNYGTLAPNMRTVGVFRHELGHVLGLRHEHTRPESGMCFENNSWRALTAYDSASVMHYPWCNGVTTSDLSITPSDAAGARQLYGASTCSGQTTKYATAWQVYDANSLYLDVNTASCGFTATPRYFASLGGDSFNWDTTGASSIYSPTPTGFRVYVRYPAPITPAFANANGWHLNWHATADNLRRSDLCAGGTAAGATTWLSYDPRTVYTDVNTAACGFTSSPRYVTSIGGNSHHWMTTGANAIYIPTATGFRVYVYDETGPVTPADANARGWHINYQAVPDATRPPATCSGGTAPGATAWQVYGTDSLYLDVDTAACGFTSAPRYVPSLGGSYNHWRNVGVTSVYIPTATGFRVYLRNRLGPVTPAGANSMGWHLNWEAR